jgi:GNAT superfamily N-acetyltransferase
MAATSTSGDEALVTVRLASLRDAAVLAGLATQLGYPSSRRDVEARLSRVLDDPKHRVLVAEARGRILGWAHAYLCCVIQSDPYVELGGLVVDESYRGGGVGGKLVSRVEEWAHENGCRTVSVRSNVIRQDAHRFYMYQGYAQVKRSTRSANNCKADQLKLCRWQCAGTMRCNTGKEHSSILPAGIIWCGSSGTSGAAAGWDLVTMG